MPRHCLVFVKILILVTSFIGFAVLPCAAHKIKVFATVEGTTISGYAYSSGGERIRNQPVLLESAHGERLGESVTGEQGDFTFSATCRCDHVVVLELADGHRATFTISAEEFPESLPGPAAESPDADTVTPVAETSLVRQPEEAVQGISSEELEILVDSAVSRHIRPLREQLEAYEDKTRLHDTLGGIGYILGLTGIAFYMLGRRKNRHTQSQEEER